MKWTGGARLAVLASLSLSLIPAYSQSSPTDPPSVRRLEIKSTLSIGGPKIILKDSGPPKIIDKKEEVDLVFEKKEGAYYLQGQGQGEDKDENKVVDANLINAVVKAMSAPVNREPSAEDLGLTPQWLQANASPVAQKFSTTQIGGRPIRQDLFEVAFVDPAIVDKAIQTLFHQHTSCNDCRHYFALASIAVTFDDGTILNARSSSEFPYMLPWTLAGNTTGTVAYNADVSRAVVALLPEKSVNRSRLAGENIDKALGRLVLAEEEHNSQLTDVENKTGATLSAIRTRYTIDSASIGNRRDFGLGAAGDGESDLVLRLTASGRPPTFKDDVALAYVDGKVVGADKFLSDGPKFEKLVLSVPWLNQYTQSHPKVPISLSFVHGASLSDAEFERFSADMRFIGQEKLIPKVEAAKDQVALLTIGQGMTGRSEWLVFPDRHMLLWRFWRIIGIGAGLDSPAWGHSQYSPKACANGETNFMQCVGREVSASGSLQP